MALPQMDHNGILRASAGTDGAGQFAEHLRSAPGMRLGADSERLRSLVQVQWRDLLKAAWREPGSREPGMVPREIIRSFHHTVSIPHVTAAAAPLAVVVEGVAGPAAGDYRNFDGKLFRQILEPRVSDHAPPPVEPARPAPPVELVPVPADAKWLEAEAARADISAQNQAGAAAAIQRHFDQFAAIDGEVWRTSAEPVYHLDVDDAGTPSLQVTPAPDTADAAADPERYFAPEEFEQARLALIDAARTAEITAAVQIPSEPPIVVVADLQVTRDWRSGVPIAIADAQSLTAETFRDELAAFREQIAQIPGAVTGDVGAFLTVGAWRMDFTALTPHQQEQYRRYVLFGASNGMI